MPQWSPNKEARPSPMMSLMQASCLEHLVEDDISDTGKDKLDKISIGGCSQVRINWPFLQIDLTLAQKSVDYEVRCVVHIIFTLKTSIKTIKTRKTSHLSNISSKSSLDTNLMSPFLLYIDSIRETLNIYIVARIKYL